MKLNNKYYILRHGEALSNVRGICSSWPEKFKNPLTGKGKKMIAAAAKILEDKHIDLIFASDLLRTKQTSQIVGKKLHIKPKFDKRLREIGFGRFNGKPLQSFDLAFKNEKERIKNASPKGETYQEVLERGYGFLKDIDRKYKNNPTSHKASTFTKVSGDKSKRRRNILIVSHESVLWMLEAKMHGMSLSKGLKAIPRDHRIHKGQVKELN